MDSTHSSVSGRLVRGLIAGGILAGGWFVVEMVVTVSPAAAIDILPGAETPVADLLDTAPDLAPALAPVLTATSPITTPVVGTTDAVLAPLAPVTTPILSPVREATQPVVDTVVSPVLEGTIDVLAPVIAPVVDGLVPIVETVATTVPTAAEFGVVAVEARIAQITSSAAVLAADTSPAVSIALLGALAVGAASMVPGGPLAPAHRSPAPDGASGSGFTFLGEILAWIQARHGSAVPAVSAARLPHASPVFASDTTPD